MSLTDTQQTHHERRQLHAITAAVDENVPRSSLLVPEKGWQGCCRMKRVDRHTDAVIMILERRNSLTLSCRNPAIHHTSRCLAQLHLDRAAGVPGSANAEAAIPAGPLVLLWRCHLPSHRGVVKRWVVVDARACLAKVVPTAQDRHFRWDKCCGELGLGLPLGEIADKARHDASNPKRHQG
mmetsp:Transcript_4828/g.14051  ORF Transcript_4828/g.14051 Transcript_4828/m.14051 type:complete len:181 (+) Transcript_4828:224-766(+)